MCAWRGEERKCKGGEERKGNVKERREGWNEKGSGVMRLKNDGFYSFYQLLASVMAAQWYFLSLINVVPLFPLFSDLLVHTTFMFLSHIEGPKNMNFSVSY